jgi:hypothetical protein
VKITYTPDGDEAQRRIWEFLPGRVRMSRAEMIQRRYATIGGGQRTFLEFSAAVLQGDAAARRVLLWHLQSLDHPTLKLEDVDIFWDELLVESNATELTEMREAVEKSKAIPADQRELALAHIDEELSKLTAVDGEVVNDGEGKALSPTSESTTG